MLGYLLCIYTRRFLTECTNNLYCDGPHNVNTKLACGLKWVKHIEIYDSIKFSSNLRVCQGAGNKYTCSHYGRQVTSDRKNERNVKRIYPTSIPPHQYSLFFHIHFIFILLILLLPSFILSFISFLLKQACNSSNSGSDGFQADYDTQRDKNEAISVFSTKVI